MVAITCALALAGCADDVYDPEKGIQTEPKENPLGKDFTAPDGFNWSMINSVNLDIEVKDEFKGQYNYLVEVFTANPLSDATATPIAAGVAKGNGNYTANINIPKATTRLYIRQTDPKQRKEIYEYEVPENGGKLNCKLYYASADTRATSNPTSASEAAKAAGITEIEDKAYKEAEVIPTIPTQSDGYFDQWNEGTLVNGAKFIIGKEYTKASPYTIQLKTNSGKATVFVQGTWKLNGWAGLYSNLDIYVMKGGEIIAENLTIGTGNTLTIQNEGKLSCTTLSLGCPTKNFGTITVSQNLTMNLGSNPELFNEGEIKAGNEISINGSNVINHSTLNANGLTLTSVQLLNKMNINCSAKIYLNNGKIFNYGNIKLNENNGMLTTNDSKATVIVNHQEAAIRGYHLKGGAAIYNDGIIEVSQCTNSSTDVLYNSCTFIVKDNFKFRNVILNKGSITAGQDKDGNWQPVPKIESQSDAIFKLTDGSIIVADEFNILSGKVEFEATNITNANKSMIKAKTIKYNWHTYLKGNLIMEGTPDFSQAGNNDECLHPDNGVIQTGYNESKYTIETCSGIINGGNEGGTPTEPELPEINESSVYTFAFEDNWPTYGDFDMNDLVLTMSSKKIKVDKNNNVTRLKMRIELRAIGASKKLGAGIRFLQLPANLQTEKFTVNGDDSSFEEGQKEATYILFSDAHLALWGNEGYKENGPFINTLPDKANLKYDTRGFDVIMEIPASAGVKADAFTISNIDVFAITTPATVKSQRTEVHVIGFAPTQLANTRYFDQGNDKSLTKKQYYTSEHNLAWGVVIPSEFAWPLEYQKISSVYPYFNKWVTSGGQQNGNENGKWYELNNGNVFPITELSPLKEN
ncbi:outer membrane protein, function unknown [Bacteroides helcogenes P 36-108]|uniref:DUF4842 domain-containing protein n=2 Tax=Bacteroides helcogenes TaxID=290053 RepID=E6SQU3_BACT6|nr:outer membrane protein, function unknown [Bacteroides helcogenes P 36-108]